MTTVEKASERLWRRLNFFGVLAGILTLLLPFSGAWWHLTLGTDGGIFSILASPFEFKFLIFNKQISTAEAVQLSPLLWWLCLAFKLCYAYFGAALLAGSLLSLSERHAESAETLVRFSSLKLLWLVVAFVVVLFIATFLVNSATQLMGGALIDFSMPYIVGTGKFAMSSGNFHIYAPINEGFTSTFAVAIIASALGIASRIYQKRISSV
ncbi:MAG: hypothetical protein OCU24_03570 [Candidatus Methanospirare jalkutatii]|nr:hypothetical protein [Candidatus Methanospirare jalkutatii]